ncbi:MAG: hypothetical protein V7K40_04770 [Nostoc sp.]|uniref:hypothetical protein n=1 Tax=Nostoc sp. TaxID=1180 RepID=UPI002FF8589A
MIFSPNYHIVGCLGGSNAIAYLPYNKTKFKYFYTGSCLKVKAIALIIGTVKT